VVWYQRAADLGDAASKATLGDFLVKGDARAGVAKDAARGFALVRETVEEGYSPALHDVAQCYLKGEGVEKDAARGVTLLHQAAEQVDQMQTNAQLSLAKCFMTGEGVEADAVQAAMWCERAAEGGEAEAIEMLPIIRTCHFCGTTPARKHCERCQSLRYCSASCQAAHWNRDTDPHKAHCRRAAPRRAAEASEEGTAPGAGGAAPTSAS